LPAFDPHDVSADVEEEDIVLEEAPPRLRPTELDEDWSPDTGLDTSDVHMADPDLAGGWGRPEWLIESDFTDSDIRMVRTGKEADVWLVRRTAGDRSCLLAVKRFRPREHRAFRREDDYRGAVSLGDERVDRAVAKRSRFGRAILSYAWAYNEFPVMRRALQAGVRVPYPVEATETGLAMQYLGDLDDPAPRLSDVRLHPRVAEEAFADVVENIRRLLDACLVHADLSAFNILWWRDKPWLIDMPQAADISLHPRGVEFLRRDIKGVCAYFRRCGVEADPSDVFDDVMRTAPFTWFGTA
jgi:RIO kinase 1